MARTPDALVRLDADSVVVGLGATGLSVVRYLHARGVALAVVDTRPEPPGLAELRQSFPRIPVVCGRNALAAIGHCRQLIMSPGVAPSAAPLAALQARGIRARSDIDLFARAVRVPIVAVTGTNGKSTVVSMLDAMYQRADWIVPVGGNIGTPALDLFECGWADAYVLELSSFQLELTEDLGARAAAVLNISPDHIDRHGSLAAYAAAKLRIFEGAEHLIINLDDPVLSDYRPAGDVIGFAAAPHPSARYWLDPAGDLHDRGGLLMRATDLGTVGRHNALNALAAIALADAAGLPREAQFAALAEFRGLPHRCVTVVEADGVRWVDDSKGTNVGATCAAVAGTCAGGGGVLIAGGQGKGADFTPLRAALAQHVDHVVLLGADAKAIAAAVEGAATVHFADSMEEAVASADALVEPGGVVLLSPACASFDMFVGYAARGAAFARAVKRLKGA